MSKKKSKSVDGDKKKELPKDKRLSSIEDRAKKLKISIPDSVMKRMKSSTSKGEVARVWRDFLRTYSRRD